ncbi:MAG TPA: hypothetical protein VEY12_03450, partial [Thermoplasmata archaeon]|nr:hypothetical protein [Thermoplasmata archaeon]
MESYRVTRKCVVAFAIAIFVLGWVVALPPAAAAKGGYLAYNAATHTYTVKPNGVDDTANIQAAFDGCASSSSRCTVQLTKGTFYTAQIVAHEFRGSFLGMGEGRTIVQALPNLPSPTADPFWTVQPGPQNPWPDMFVFLNGSFAVTAMTLSEPYDVPTQGWFCCGLPAIDALHAAIMITGEHADVAIEHV